MIEWRQFYKHVLLNPAELALAKIKIEKSVREFFDHCQKKDFEILDILVKHVEVEINNAAGECVARTVINALVHQPEQDEIVCGTMLQEDSYMIVSVSKYFKILVKNPKHFENEKVHAKITLIKSQKSCYIIALGEQVELTSPALRCSCCGREAGTSAQQHANVHV